MKVLIEKDRLKEIIKCLKKNSKIEYSPYPQYGAYIYDLLSSLNYDRNYLTKYAKIENKDIDDMTLGDIKVMFTFYTRGERFSDGLIASAIEDGTLLKLAERELKLLTK